MRAERLALALGLVTVVLWVLHTVAFERVLRLSPDTEKDLFEVLVVDDSRDGGASQAHLVRTDSSYILLYDLRPGAPYPFATMQFHIARNGRGLDLSEYDRIDLRIRGEGQHTNRIRLHVRHFHPEYSDINDPISLKYNEVHFPALGLDSTLRVHWNDFHVAGWWIAMKDIPFQHSSVQVTDVRWIEFITPEKLTSGKGLLEIASVEFRGKWISATRLFQILLLLWMITFGIYALAQFLQLRQTVRAQETHKKELLHINEALSIHAQEMEKKAIYDSLTGLYNRHGLRDRLYSALETVRQNGVELSVVFADIDHFKKVNDTYGHERGDEILAATAKCFKTHIRESDLLARWGGEEFLLICPGATLDTAERIANKLRECVELLPEGVTCSFGVASLFQGGSIQATIQKADKALYCAKQKGRNRVETAG